VLYPIQFHFGHALDWDTAGAMVSGVLLTVPCHHFRRFEGIGFQPFLDIRAHLRHGDVVEDSELVESVDGSVEEAIRVRPPDVVMCL
jgi:hypothetical protein